MNRNLMLQTLFMFHRKTVAHYFALLHDVLNMLATTALLLDVTCVGVIF